MTCRPARSLLYRRRALQARAGEHRLARRSASAPSAGRGARIAIPRRRSATRRDVGAGMARQHRDRRRQPSGQALLANTVTENGGDPADQSALDLIELPTGKPRSLARTAPRRRRALPRRRRQRPARLADDRPARPPAPCGTITRSSRCAPTPTATTTLSFEVAGREARRRRRLRRDGAAVQHAAPRRPRSRDCRPPSIDVIGRWAWARTPRSISSCTTRPGRRSASAARPTANGSAWPAAGTTPFSSALLPARRCYLAFPGGRVGRVGSHRQPRTAPRRRADVAGRCARSSTSSRARRAAYTGRAYEDHWALDPWVDGAYSYYRVGQAANVRPARRRHRRPLPVRRRAHLDRQHRLPRRSRRDRRARRPAAVPPDRALSTRAATRLRAQFHNLGAEGSGSSRGLHK